MTVYIINKLTRQLVLGLQVPLPACAVAEQTWSYHIAAYYNIHVLFSYC